MKKLLLLLLVVTTVCNAQVPLEKNQNGEFRKEIKTSEKWNKSDIVAKELALRYTEKFPSAISNPGKKVLVNKSEKLIRLKPVCKKLVEIQKDFIIYNDSTKIISYLKLKEEEKKSSYLIIFGIISLILMMISNVFFYKNNNIIITTFSAISGLAAFIAITTTFNTIISFSAASAAAFAAFIALVVALEEESKSKLITYYTLMAIHFLLLFI